MEKPAVYFFDMDFTLQDNDSDVSWKQFLMGEGLAPADTLEQVDYYFAQYQRGELQLDAFFRFQLAEFIGRTPAEMAPLLERHFELYSRPKIYPAARELVAQCRSTGGKVVVLTSTNRSIAAPLGRYLAMDDVLACRLEVRDGCYTGRLADEYSGGPGKVNYATAYCRRHGYELAQTAYFGDGIYDRYILEAVGFPTAVNPVPALRELATQRGWNIIDFN
ncbi:MAG: HAD family phosphatase [Victivallales bacterium]|nr:HAD family phosphatase [Victivallales bacterium]